MKNNYLYQGSFAELDDDIGWNDFALRNYDAQIGRWVQQDPYQEYTSPYLALGNDPVNLVDPTGGFTITGLTKAGTVAIMTIGCAIIGTVVGLVSGDDNFTGTLIGAGAGLVSGLGSLIQRISASMCIHTINVAASVFNSSSNTQPVGNIEHGPSAGSTEFGSEPINSNFKEPPIFWEEFWTPEIEEIDYNYAKYYAPTKGIKVKTDSRYPNVKFLVLHYESSKEKQEKNGRDARSANSYPKNPDSDQYELHEVAYKSTKEGGKDSIMILADASQNASNGGSLTNFYRRNGLKDGDEFWVPLYEPKIKKPKAPNLPIAKVKSNTDQKNKPGKVIDFGSNKTRDVGAITTAAIVFWWIIKIALATETGGASLAF